MWLLVGDFNDILHFGEKIGGKSQDRRISFLGEFMQLVGAINLGFSRQKFTWENRQSGHAYIKERLDRCLMNKDWLCLFTDTTVKHHVAKVSNHISIMLDTAGSMPFSKRSFKLFEAWTSEDRSSREVVKMAWDKQIRRGMESHRIQRKLNGTARAFLEWNIVSFGIAHERIKDLEKKLEELQFKSNGNIEPLMWVEEDLRIQRSRQENIAR